MNDLLKKKETVCLVAILLDEQKFLDEWIVYHRMIGIQHFFLYDNDPELPLKDYLSHHKEYVDVIPWTNISKTIDGPRNQSAAYEHALENFLLAYEWVLFLDADEFVVLRQHDSVSEFLKNFKDVSAVSLNWHVFGHNGYYQDPESYITSSLTRRMSTPSNQIKTFSRTEAIKDIGTAHQTNLKYGGRVDANKKWYNDVIYPGRTDVAHINHYQCRSFSRWMKRVSRGDVNFDSSNAPKEHQWRLSEELCLKQFVTTIAYDKNELIDEYMLQFTDMIHENIQKLKST